MATKQKAPDVPPPHDEDAETAVLGAILLAENWLPAVQAKIGLIATDFYRPRHRVIFAALVELSEQGTPLDTATLPAHLERTGTLEQAGGRDYIETLVTRIPAIANTESYARIVRENAMLRGLLGVSRAIERAIAGGEPPSEIAEKTLVAVADAIRPESDGLAAPTDERLLWAADFAIREARSITSSRDAYTLLALALRSVEGSYDAPAERRRALRQLAATALYVVGRELPAPERE